MKTIDDLMTHELIVGATGSIGDAVSFPRVLNATLGTKFKVITGYPGSTEALLAMERGETQGFCSMGFATLEATRPQWVHDRKVNIFVQLALRKNNDHPDVPLALDLARTTADRQAIELIVSPNQFARPFTARLAIPTERVAALRQAFDDTMSGSRLYCRGDDARPCTCNWSPGRRSSRSCSGSTRCRRRSSSA